MNQEVLLKLLAVVLTVAIGWVVGRMRWLGEAQPTTDTQPGSDPARVLSNAAFYIFMPALLFRTTARLDVANLPWLTLAGFLIPVHAHLLAVYLLQRWRSRGQADAARPSVQAITATFGNTLQVGLPVAAAVFGETGLAIHITVLSLHGLTLLTVLTVLVEQDLARARQSQSGLWRTARVTARNTLIHPVVLPVLGGFVWQLLIGPLPPVLDEVLQLLGTAVVPLCLTLIGMSLAYYGWPRQWQGVLGLVGLKLLLLPLLTLAVAWTLGLRGLPLQVVVMMAALPVGSNALIFAQRYRSQQTEATAAIVLSTLAYVLTAPVFLWLLGRVA